ncbi:MAG: hypothetical protein VX561_10760 [Pseudomonadota bacterium]|nr:hypothetical protein [Pseudomonadota bacterium]
MTDQEKNVFGCMGVVAVVALIWGTIHFVGQGLEMMRNPPAATAKAAEAQVPESDWHYTGTPHGWIASTQAPETVRMPGNVLGSYFDFTLTDSGGAYFRISNGGTIYCAFDELRISIDGGQARTYECQQSEHDHSLIFIMDAEDLAPALVGSTTLSIDFPTVSERRIVKFSTAGLKPREQWSEKVAG